MALLKKKTKKILKKPQKGTSLIKKKTLTNLNEPVVEEKVKSKPHEYKMFLMWMMIPPDFLGKTEEQLYQQGLDDPVYVELIKIKNRTEFAKRYGVSKQTLTAWSKDISTMEQDEELNKFLNVFTKRLMISFYREQLRRPTPQGIMTWHEIVKNRSRNLNINLKGEVTHDLPEEEKEHIRKIIRGFSK